MFFLLWFISGCCFPSNVHFRSKNAQFLFCKISRLSGTISSLVCSISPSNSRYFYQLSGALFRSVDNGYSLKVSFQVFWNCMIPPTKHLEFGLVWQYKEPQQSSDIGRRNAKKMWKTLSVGNNRDLHCKDEPESYGFTIIKEILGSGCQGLVVITEISFLLIAGNFTANVDLIDHFCFVLFYTSNGPCTKKNVE